MQLSCVKIYRNTVALSLQLAARHRLLLYFRVKLTMPVSRAAPHSVHRVRTARSILSWPAWQRVLAMLPAVALLWLAVAWANSEIAPW